MDQEELREKLIRIIGDGLSARAISRHVDITYDILAKFKQKRLCLMPQDAEKLDKYLKKVVIP